MKKPLVSICCITYNHQKYIAQALDGFLMQKTNFDFEIIIGEDSSTDTTKEIIDYYIQKYPNRITLLSSEKNIGGMYNFKKCFENCRGKYITICEGDDFWTEPYKLQKQIDFLEVNEDFAMCFHNMNVLYDDNRESHVSNDVNQKVISTIEDLAELGNFITTASCVFRNYMYKLPEWYFQCTVGDYILHLLNARNGKIYYMDEVMGVYRIHSKGVWGNKHFIHKHINWIHLLDILIGKFDENINEILRKQKESSITKFINFLEVQYEKKEKLEKNVLESTPYRLGNFLLSPYYFIKKLFHA